MPLCRLLAYRGGAVLLESLVCAPVHSLIHPSRSAREARNASNGDGFGLGWYGERVEPGAGAGLIWAAGVTDPLQFTVALTDGARLRAFRRVSDDTPATLCWRQESGALIVMSALVDSDAAGWHALPPGEAVEISAMAG